MFISDLSAKSLTQIKTESCSQLGAETDRKSEFNIPFKCDTSTYNNLCSLSVASTPEILQNSKTPARPRFSEQSEVCTKDFNDRRQTPAWGLGPNADDQCCVAS